MTGWLIAIIGTVTVIAVPGAAQAHVDNAGDINCVLTGGVVFDPTVLSQASRLTGDFGTTAGLPSTVQCAGTITGTALVSGGFTTCRQGDPGTPPAIPACTKPDPFAPASDVVWNGVNMFNAQGLGPMTQVTGTGSLSPTAQGAGLHYSDDPLSQLGLVTCSFDFFGHAPVVELKITLKCKASAESSSRSYVGAATASFVPLMSVAGNQVQGAPHANCPDPTVSHNPADAQCFRAVIFDGDIQASYPAPT